MSYVFLAIVIYILYRFIFGFVLPILNASRKMRERMRDVHGNMDGYGTGEQETNIKKPGFSSNNKDASRPSSKDYIEFEEIK